METQTDRVTLKHFPRAIATTFVGAYFFSLVLVSMVFYRYSMSITFMLIGAVEVVGFFLLGSYLTRQWADIGKAAFLRNVLLTAFGLRAAWVLFSYFFYISQTGLPFEYHSADALGYWEDSVWLTHSPWKTAFDYLFTSRSTVSDSGYIFYLTALGKLIGNGIIPTRLVKSAWSTLTVYLIYRLARSNFGEPTGRIAAVFACLFPNLIIYCGLHLKETEMITLAVAFLERTDYLLRSRKPNVINIVLPVLLALSLFTFRTVMGATALFAAATALVFSTAKVVGTWRRVMLIAWGLLAVWMVAGGSIQTEVEDVWESRMENQAQRRSAQAMRGNQWTKYATGTVMAPMSFLQPFPTMVRSENQEQQLLLHGGNFVRDALGVFVLIALFSVIFIAKNWRDLSLLEGYTAAYLVIISMSAFAGSERFLLPALPGLIIFAAHGVTLVSEKNYKWVKMWYVAVPLMAMAWAYFKLGNKGML